MDGHPLRRFPYTSVTLALAIVVIVAGMLWHINVFQFPGLDIIGLEETEIAEAVIVVLMLIPAVFLDRVVNRQRAHEAQLQAEQLRVLRVTMRTVQDIVNNNLNELQVLRMEAEGCVPEETLAHFDRTIHDTAAKLTAVGNMDTFAEKPMESGSGLDVGTPNAGNL
jgi:hypothetical protein